jgi:hypothetical protein
MQHAKSLFDELVAAGWPLSLEDFNLYIFYGLRGEFKDLVTSLVTKAEPLSYLTFIVIFLLMSFCIRLPFHPWLQIHLCCPHHLFCPLLILLSISTTLISIVTVTTLIFYILFRDTLEIFR